MRVWVADAHAYVQRLVSVVKIENLLERCTIKEQHSVVHFLWGKGLNTMDIHKEMFTIYGGKCLSRKALHNWAANISLMMKRLKWRC
jgi:hypothetical protein